MTDKVILCDVDGVLGDFVGDILTQVNSPLKPEDINDWDMFSLMENARKGDKAKVMDILAKEYFWRHMALLPHAKESIQNLRKHGRVVFVTAPWIYKYDRWLCKTWGWGRTEWLREHFDASMKDVIIGYDKGICQGDILIDDKYDNVCSWQKANPNGTAILVERPYSTEFPWEYRIKICEDKWDWKYPKHPKNLWLSQFLHQMKEGI